MKTLTNNQLNIMPLTLNIEMSKPEQTGQAQIRLLLEEQSDQGLHCLQCSRSC